MYRVLRHIAIAASVLIPACQAQALLDQGNAGGNATGAAQEGAGIYSVSVFSGYSTSAYPAGAGQAILPGAGILGPDENYGASAILGWQHHRDKGGFSIRYSGSYMGLVHYSDANGYSQTLSLTADRTLARKWNVHLSVYGQDSTLIQFLNEPSATSVTSQVPSDFNDFAAAFGLGSFSTAQAASAILGAPVVQTPLSALLLGNKVLSYSGNAGLNYAVSRHFSLHASSLVSGGQNRSGDQVGTSQINYVLPFSYGGNAGMGWTYSPSPRTDLGVNIEGNDMQSRLQSSYTGTTTASFGRKMGMHWFLKMYGGGALTGITEQISGSPRTRQFVGGGSIGVKTYTGTFVVKYDRGANNSYGVAGTYSALSGSWNWHHPGGRLSLFASASQQQLSDTGFESLSGWQAGAGFSVRTTAKTSLTAQYTYFTTAGNYLGNASSLSEQSVRLSMSWSPPLMLR